MCYNLCAYVVQNYIPTSIKQPNSVLALQNINYPKNPDWVYIRV